MKKVLLVTGSLNVGGLQKVAMEIVRTCDSKEFSFDFLVYGEESFDYEQEAIELGCKVIRIPKPRKRYLRYYYNLKSVILNNGPYDIVHSHVYFNSSIVVLAAKKAGVAQCIAHSHSIKRISDNKASKKLIYTLMRIILNRYSDKFAACSSVAGNYVFGNKGFLKKGQIIFNPVEIETFVYSNAGRIKIREEFNISSEQKVIGHVGRLVGGKNQKFLIDLFFVYQMEYDSILLVVGDGVLKDELEDYAKQLGIYEKVRFAGQRDDISDLLSAMNIFIMPSLHEGLGIVLIEAMSNGLTCLCEDNAIVDEIKALNRCISMRGFDVFEWKQMIVNVLSKNMNHYTQRDVELQKFDKTNFKANIYRLYLDLK